MAGNSMVELLVPKFSLILLLEVSQDIAFRCELVLEAELPLFDETTRSQVILAHTSKIV